MYIITFRGMSKIMEIDISDGAKKYDVEEIVVEDNEVKPLMVSLASNYKLAHSSNYNTLTKDGKTVVMASEIPKDPFGGLFPGNVSGG